MPNLASRPLRVFLCHSSGDKPTVRELYQKLNSEGWIDVWLDDEKLLVGQDWEYEIENALDNSDAVIVTLSTDSILKEGYVQKELRFVLDIALEKPEGAIFVLPLRLNDCKRPLKLRNIHGLDYFPLEERTRTFERLLKSLKKRANDLGITASKSKSETRPILKTPKNKPIKTESRSTVEPTKIDDSSIKFQNEVFTKVPAGRSPKGVAVPYDYYITLRTVSLKFFELDHEFFGVQDLNKVKAFCQKTNEAMKKAGLLPTGMIVRLPRKIEYDKGLEMPPLRMYVELGQKPWLYEDIQTPLQLLKRNLIDDVSRLLYLVIAPDSS